MNDEEFLDSLCAAGRVAVSDRSYEELVHIEGDEPSFGTV
jgi:hypothetical protein